MPQAQPELKKVSLEHQSKLPLANLHKYLEKRVLVQLNGSRKVMGILRGYDVCILRCPPKPSKVSSLCAGLLEHCAGRCAGGEGRR